LELGFLAFAPSWLGDATGEAVATCASPFFSDGSCNLQLKQAEILLKFLDDH
jgi:hypothetical protein